MTRCYRIAEGSHEELEPAYVGGTVTERPKPGEGLEQPVAATADRPSEVAALLAEFPVVVDLPVAWGEMDAMGHVNGVVFIRYFETSRFTYFARLGPALEGMGTAERGWILASLTCRYRAPLAFPDTVSVGTRVAAVGTDRYLMEHRVVSHRLGKVAAEGDVLIVAYDYRTGSKTPLLETDRAAIAAIEGHEPPAMKGPPLPDYRKIDLVRSPLHRVESVSRGPLDGLDTTTSEAVAE
jgi:acyl-CoA thioester hydrolase